MKTKIQSGLVHDLDMYTITISEIILSLVIALVKRVLQLENLIIVLKLSIKIAKIYSGLPRGKQDCIK